MNIADQDSDEILFLENSNDSERLELSDNEFKYNQKEKKLKRSGENHDSFHIISSDDLAIEGTRLFRSPVFNFKLVLLFFLTFFIPQRKEKENLNLIKLTKMEKVKCLMKDNWSLIIGNENHLESGNVAVVDLKSITDISIIDVLIGGNWKKLNEIFEEEKLFEEDKLMKNEEDEPECMNDEPENRHITEVEVRKSESTPQIKYNKVNEILSFPFKTLISQLCEYFKPKSIKRRYKFFSEEKSIYFRFKIENGVLHTLRNEFINKIDLNKKVNILNVLDIYWDIKIKFYTKKIVNYVRSYVEKAKNRIQ